MRRLALLAIRLYQQHLSPYKGFCCAYGAHTGHASCSTLGLRAVRRFGVWEGVAILDRRLAKYGVAHRRYRHAPLARQAGSCDLPCDLPGDCFDASDCCDWNKKRKQSRNEQDIHVPPRRDHRRRQPPP